MGSVWQFFDVAPFDGIEFLVWTKIQIYITDINDVRLKLKQKRNMHFTNVDNPLWANTDDAFLVA